MSVSLIGIISAFIGVVGHFRDIRFLIYAFVISTLFVSSSAMDIGRKPITLSFLFLAFLVLYLLRTPHFVAQLLRIIQTNRAALAFFIYFFYALIITIVNPFIFEGEVWVFLFSQFGQGLQLLSFSGSHVAQIIYAIASLFIFLLIIYLMTLRMEFIDVIAKALLWLGVVNICFGLLDILIFYAGFPDVISFFRNAEYAMLDQTFGEVRRIAGVFPETSAFSSFTITIACFSYFLWRAKYLRRLSGFVTSTSLLFVLIATSTSGYVGIAIFVLLAALAEIPDLRKGLLNKTIFFTILTSIIMLVLLFAIFYEEVFLVLDAAVFNKMSSQSGVERMEWNMMAWDSFIQSNGFGVGLGGNRSSSYLMVLLSNVGWIGFLLYFFALSQVFRGSMPALTTEHSAIASAAKKCLIVSLLPAMAGATVPFQGSLFYVLLAVASLKTLKEHNQLRQ